MRKRFYLWCVLIIAISALAVAQTSSKAFTSGIHAVSTSRGAARAQTPSTSLAGRWLLDQTGEIVEIDSSGGTVRAHISGIEWNLTEEGPDLTASRLLTKQDARSMFPDIADAPMQLAGKLARLVVTPAPAGASYGATLTIGIQGTVDGGPAELPILTGSLIKPSESTSKTSVKHKRRREPGAGTIRPQAAVSLQVAASEAPNLLGSPSFAGWEANELTALQNGMTSIGNPATTPTAYFQVTQRDDRGNIVTGFPSWQGIANPGTAFGSAFAAEVGNRVHFGFHIVGNGTQFKLSNIQFHLHGTDVGDSFGLDGDFSAASYSPARVGLNYGPDRIKGTPDDFTVTSGAGTQLVDELTYVGVGTALAPDGVTCTGTTQATLDCVKGQYDAIIPFSLTTSYDLFDDSSNLLANGSATVLFKTFGNCVSITCPGNIVASAAPHQSTAVVTFAPVATVACGETVQVVSVPPSGSAFPAGTTTVTSTATDGAGDQVSCSFTVTVNVFTIILQDSGGVLSFNPQTGDYTFTRCGPGGFTITGTGTVRTVGGMIILTASQPGRKVTASFLPGQMTGKASITLNPAPGSFQTFTITSTNPNPSGVCGS
ncbi:MAG TPA: HYR domain-containing protein [Blastocatellia bacterium]|nr:HYR domain-containing protein [Blastocatellia bacterium]